MELEEENLLSNSCESYILENGIVISSYPGSIVFGKTETNKKYLDESSFKFNTFQVIELFKSIVAIVTFFNDKNEKKTDKIIDFNYNTVYFWRGDSVTNENNKQIKLIKFGIEKNCEAFYFATFSLQQINSLVYLLKRCVISSLCLKYIEEQFIESVVVNPLSEIKACKTNDLIAYKIVEKFFKEKQLKVGTKKASYIEILNYYNSVILLIKNLSSLYFPNE